MEEQVPNSHLADRIAGKVDEAGNKIEPTDTVEVSTDDAVENKEEPLTIGGIPVEEEKDTEKSDEE